MHHTIYRLHVPRQVEVAVDPAERRHEPACRHHAGFLLGLHIVYISVYRCIRKIYTRNMYKIMINSTVQSIGKIGYQQEECVKHITYTTSYTILNYYIIYSTTL